jgi:hypothetical protein
MQRQSFFRIESGRFFVSISLQEAESLRAIMHSRQDAPILADAPTTLALRTVAPTGAGQILEHSFGFQRAGKHQEQMAHCVYRFIDSQPGFNERERNLLVRALEGNSSDSKIAWFDSIKSCRRRAKKSWDVSPVAQVLRTLDSFELLEVKAVCYGVRTAIKAKGLIVSEAYKVFNVANNAKLTCSELFSASKWLGVTVSVDQIHAVVQSVDSDLDGYLNFPDFKAAFYEDGDEKEVLAAFGTAETVIDTYIPQVKIRELYDDMDADEHMVEIAEEVVCAFKVKSKLESRLQQVWSSEGTGARNFVSVWRPKLTGHNSDQHVISICVGYYASRTDSAPDNAFVIHVRDTQVGMVGRRSKHMRDVVRRFMPHPKRFHQVWTKQTGDQDLYVWKPIPHSKSFVALGMVVTTVDEPPDLETIRCVPRQWATPSTTKPELLWTDAGSGGKPGALWCVNAEGLFAASNGHAPPSETFYTLKSQEFFIDPTDDGRAAAVAPAPEPRLDTSK